MENEQGGEQAADADEAGKRNQSFLRILVNDVATSVKTESHHVPVQPIDVSPVKSLQEETVAADADAVV